MNILLVEDNDTITKGLEFFLKKNGYQVKSVKTLKEAKENLKNIDFMILDVVLPDGNGFCFYEQEAKAIKTLFLTVKDEEDDIVRGLEIGAEDYMTKPFSSKELLVRMEKILYREKKKNIKKVENIVFDMDKMLLYKEEKLIELTPLELKILHLLFQNLGKVVSRNMLLDHIWTWTGNDVDDHTITVYMKRIRGKIGIDIITTVKGIGYRVDGETRNF